MSPVPPDSNEILNILRILLSMFLVSGSLTGVTITLSYILRTYHQHRHRHKPHHRSWRDD